MARSEQSLATNVYTQQQHPSTTTANDKYLPEEPILLTDFEEKRLAEQISRQLGSTSSVDRLKLLFQELAAFDMNRTNYVHYSQIQAVTQQLGVGYTIVCLII
jgi:hypothetical protein